MSGRSAALALAIALAVGPAAAQDDGPRYEVRPVGWVRKEGGRTFIAVDPRYQPALLDPLGRSVRLSFRKLFF